MVILRCTTRLLSQLKVEPITEPQASTTRLGDWYAHLLFFRPTRLIICISERTLLPVIIPAKELATFPERLTVAVGGTLEKQGINESLISAELEQMNSFALCKTASRRVLGSLNDFVRMLEHYNGIGLSLPEISRRLAETPCGPLGMESPEEATPKLFTFSIPRNGA